MILLIALLSKMKLCDIRAISTIFMEYDLMKNGICIRGYNAMLEKLSPSCIICFGKPFDDMNGNIVAVDYLSSRKVVR